MSEVLGLGPHCPTLGIVNNTPGVGAQPQTSVMDSVGLDLEPQNPGPDIFDRPLDINNGQCGPRPLGPGPEPLGSGPDVFNRPLDINNGECGPRPTHQ